MFIASAPVLCFWLNFVLIYGSIDSDRNKFIVDQSHKSSLA